MPYDGDDVFSTITSMEEYLECLQEDEDPSLEGKSVSQILRPKYLPESPSAEDLRKFEFLMSLRWG